MTKYKRPHFRGQRAPLLETRELYDNPNLEKLELWFWYDFANNEKELMKSFSSRLRPLLPIDIYGSIMLSVLESYEEDLAAENVTEEEAFHSAVNSIIEKFSDERTVGHPDLIEIDANEFYSY